MEETVEIDSNNNYDAAKASQDDAEKKPKSVKFEDSDQQPNNIAAAASDADKLKSSAISAVLGQVFVVVMMIAIVNMLLGFSWDATLKTKDNMHIAIWIPQSSSTAQIETSLKYVIANQQRFNLQFNFDLLTSDDVSMGEVKDRVKYGKYWGAFAVNSQASANLMTTLLDPSAPISSSRPPSCYYWYDQARAGPSLQYSLGPLGSLISSYTSVALKQQIISLVQQGKLPHSINVPLLSNLIVTETVNLAPVEKYGLFVVAGGGVMQLFLINILNSIALMTIYAELQGRGILSSDILWAKSLHRNLASFLLAVWVPVVVWILDPGDIISSQPRIFFSVWAFVWLSLVVLGAMTYLFSIVFGGSMGVLIGISILILMMASNTSVIPFDIMPDFFKFGMAFPFYSIVQGLRSVLFQSETNLLRQSILILFGWYFALFIYVSYIFNRIPQKVTTFIKLFKDPEEEAANERIEGRIRSLTIQRMRSLSEEQVKFEEMGQPPSEIDKQAVLEALRNVEDGTDDGSALVAAAEAVGVKVSVDDEAVSIFNPSVRSEVLQVLKKGVFIEIFLSVLFIILLFLTYGNTWDVSRFHKNVNVAMVNLDQPVPTIIGQTPFEQAFDYIANPQSAPAALIQSAFGLDVQILETNPTTTFESLKNLVEDGKYWGIFVVNPTASREMMTWLYSSTSAPTQSSVTLIYKGATGGSYVNVLVRRWAAAVSAAFTSVLSQKLTQMAFSNDITKFTATTIAAPVSFSTLNLHPFPADTPGIDGAINSCAMCLYLGMIVQAGIIQSSHRQIEEMSFPYTTRVIAKGIHIGFGTLLLALVPTVSILWFGYEMSAHKFFELWSFLWLTACSFASFIFMNYHLFGPAMGGMANILLFALNQASSTASLPLILQPRFFIIGYGMPYFQAMTGCRYILFGTNFHDFQRAVGVLFVWVGVISIAALRLVQRKQHLEYMKNSVTSSFAYLKKSSKAASSSSLEIPYDGLQEDQNNDLDEIQATNETEMTFKNTI